jgi:hypothetical protein
VIAQTTIEECDGVADERLEAMGLLNDEIKLWVSRCKRLVRVLQEVEMERDNYKAGEGHAKELGTGLKVKLEDTGIEQSNYEERTSTPIPLDNTNLQTSNNAPGAAMLQPTTESNNKLEESLAGQYDLQARLDAASSERDAYRQVMVHEQESTSEYKKRLEQSELSLHNLQAQAEVIAKGQVSHEVDTMGEQSQTSHTDTQLAATNTAIRAELRTAQQSLELSKSSQISAHRHYTKALQGIFDFVEWHIKPAPSINIIVSQRRTSLSDIYEDFTEEFGWMAKTMLETREAEFDELCGRDSIHEHRSRSSPGREGEVSHFQSIVGQARNKYKSPRVRKTAHPSRTMGHISPSRSDKEALPATWARWDQIYEDAIGSPTALLDIEFLRSTRHGHWPEVTLVIYSWSFYKIHDTTWYCTKSSKRLLKALVEIWWGCDSYLLYTPELGIYETSAPIITGYPHVHCEGFMSEEDSNESEEDTDEETDEDYCDSEEGSDKSTEKEAPAEHDQELAVSSTV